MSDISNSDSEEKDADDENIDDGLKDLETEVQNEHLMFGENAKMASPAQTEDNMPPTLNKVELEFGIDTGMISYVSKDGEDFFFTQTNHEVSVQNSYFEALAKNWQAMKLLPSRFDSQGVELPSDENDPDAIFTEMYVPEVVIRWHSDDRQAYLERGYEAIRGYFRLDRGPQGGSGTDKTEKGSRQHEDKNKVVLTQVDSKKVSAALENIESIAKSLKKDDKKEETAKTQEFLANKVFEALDPNIPKMHKTTMVLAAPIPPALVGLQQKNRRLTGATWRQIRLEHYNLSPEQLKDLSPILKLAPTPEDEALTAAMSPPLAAALAELLKKNADFSLPTFKLFNQLWQLTTSDEEYGVKLNEFEAFKKDSDLSETFMVVETKEVLAIFTEMLKICQHQVMTNSLLAYQMKQQIGNLVTSKAKNKATHKMLSETIKSNLDLNPHLGILGNVQKNVKSFTTSQKVMAKAGIQVGMKRNAEFSLTSEAPAKRPKDIQMIIRDRYQNHNFAKPGGSSGSKPYYGGNNNNNPRYNSGSGNNRRYSAGGGGGGNKGNYDGRVSNDRGAKGGGERGGRGHDGRGRGGGRDGKGRGDRR